MLSPPPFFFLERVNNWEFLKKNSAACIRGHRVKKCNHKDRPMIPLVKRGRQVSQCNHCRDLRQTNQSHVKCTCAIASSKFFYFLFWEEIISRSRKLTFN